MKIRISSLIKFRYNYIIFQDIFKNEKVEYSLLFIKFLFPLDNREKINTDEIHLKSELIREMQHFLMVYNTADQNMYTSL